MNVLVMSTPMPPPIVHHSATVYRFSARPVEEPDPNLLVWALWPIAFVAIVVLACCLWPFGESA